MIYLCQTCAYKVRIVIRWLKNVFVCNFLFTFLSCFFGVYSMAVDTLFLCFLEDLERNDGTPERPYYMSK